MKNYRFQGNNKIIYSTLIWKILFIMLVIVSVMALIVISKPVNAAPASSKLLLSTVDNDLRNTIPNGSGEFLAQVRGYFVEGDGGGGSFRYINNTGANPVIDDGMVIGAFDNAGVLQGKWLRVSDSSVINVKWFGIQGNSDIDDSSAIQAAIDYAASAGSLSTTVFFPVGDYYANEIDWKQFVSLVGEGIGQSRIFYNGPGGTGSTILSKILGHGIETLEGLSLIGTITPNPANTNNINPRSNHILVIGSAAQVDNNAIFNNLQFAFSLDNAIQIEGGWVNFHLDNIRFDGVGGYGIRLVTVPGQDIRPFSIRNFTLDNTISPLLVGSGLPWGKGLLRVDDGGHTGAPGTFKLDTGRLEFNRPLIAVENGVIAAIYLQHATGAGEEYTLEHNSVHISEISPSGSYIFSETRSRNVFTNISFGTTVGTFLYADNGHIGDIIANNYNFIRVNNTQPGLGRPGVYGNNGNSSQAPILPLTETQVEFSDGSVTDSNNEWLNNQWVCKVGGLYTVSFKAGLSNLETEKWIQGRVHINGVASSVSFVTSASANIPTFVAIHYTVNLSPGDTVDFRVLHNDLVARSIIPGFIYTKMSITYNP